MNVVFTLEFTTVHCLVFTNQEHVMLANISQLTECNMIRTDLECKTAIMVCACVEFKSALHELHVLSMVIQ